MRTCCGCDVTSSSCFAQSELFLSECFHGDNSELISSLSGLFVGLQPHSADVDGLRVFAHRVSYLLIADHSN